MAWHLTGDVSRYLSAAGAFLHARAAENTVLLTAAESVRARGVNAFGDQPPLFGWWAGPDGTVAGAFIHTPPYPAALSRLPAGAAAALARDLAAAGRNPPGVNADAETGPAFASAWQARTGCEVTLDRRMRLYRLAALSPPDPLPPGTARTAGPADRELLLDWVTAFGYEVGDLVAGPERTVSDRLSYGGLTLWQTGGQPVSMAGLTRQVACQVRVGPVYTPPQFRGCGFAAAVTAAVSAAALAAGAAEVVLFTDLANPTSNDLYLRLGYQPVSDHVSLQFRPAGRARQ